MTCKCGHAKSGHAGRRNMGVCTECYGASSHGQQTHCNRFRSGDSMIKAKGTGTGLAKPRGAGPKTEEVKMRATPALKADIEAEAARCKMTVSAWLTWLVEREMEL